MSSKTSKIGNNRMQRRSLSMNQTYTPEQLRLKMTEKLWLYYFNDILCKKGLISQEERQRMKLRIDSEYDHFLHYVLLFYRKFLIPLIIPI